ncbi:MAG: hypothetical protein UCJ13_10510, partial [Bacteroidaceae bacterium]|nr:hypothetical protein [Bacteroidaceae bacterium]
LSISLPAFSITTLVLPIERLTIPTANTVHEGTLMIVPQSNCEMALSGVNGRIQLAPSNASDKSQLWTFTYVEGKYRLTNGVGETITDTGRYALAAIGKTAEGQLFHIEPVEDYFYKITNTEGKAFDLQEQMLLEGTPVGLYPYGPSVSADTRNWQLIPIRL